MSKRYPSAGCLLITFSSSVPASRDYVGAMNGGFIWRASEGTSSDWNGTAQLDHRRSADLARLAGLDSEKWMVVAFDIGGGENGHDLRVVAVDRDLIPEAADELRGIAARWRRNPRNGIPCSRRRTVRRAAKDHPQVRTADACTRYTGSADPHRVAIARPRTTSGLGG